MYRYLKAFGVIAFTVNPALLSYYTIGEIFVWKWLEMINFGANACVCFFMFLFLVGATIFSVGNYIQRKARANGSTINGLKYTLGSL